MTAEAATKRELTRFDFGEQLGATKLARVLGCSRTYAYKLMEIELVSAVRIDGNGRQWVPRAAVDTLADPAGRCCSMTGARRAQGAREPQWDDRHRQSFDRCRQTDHLPRQ